MKAFITAAFVLASAAAAPADGLSAPRINLNAPSGDVIEGEPAAYGVAVVNDGPDPIFPPIVVSFNFSPGLALYFSNFPGWSCTFAAPGGNATCEWFSDLNAGDSTTTVDLALQVEAPYGTPDQCEPGRSPCISFRASTPGAAPAARQSVVIAGGNHPPQAADDLAAVGTPPAAIAIAVLANDGDADGDALDVSILAAPAHGTAVVDPATLQVLYTPAPDFPDSDSFRYRVTDPSGATASAQVNLVHFLPGSVYFESALVDFGNMEIGHVGLHRTLIRNLTTYELFGDVTAEAVPPAQVPAVLSGTTYDPSQVVFDPDVFQPTNGVVTLPSWDPFAFLFKARLEPPLGRVYLAKITFRLNTLQNPSDYLFASTYVVARSADASEVPVHINDDAVTVLADRMTVIHPLGNDVSVAGIPFSVTGIGIAEPWNFTPPQTQGQLAFLFPTPFLGVEFTPNPGFLGATDFWYAASETPNGIFNDRYDYAKVTVTVIPAVPPPVAVASGSTQICAGGSAPLFGSGGVSCSWSPATGLNDAASCTPMAAPLATTTYTLTVLDQYGQPSTNNPTVTIGVAPLPIAVAAGSATITAGQSTPLSGSGGASCLWSPATGLDNAASCTPMASPIVTTTYALVVTSAAGCVSTNPASATITVVPPTGGSSDLVIAALIAPPNATPGQALTVWFTTQNVGAGSAGASVTRLYLSNDNVLDPTDPVVGTDAIAALAPGAFHSQVATVTMPAQGNYFLIAAADAASQVTETNEGNNTDSTKVKVKRLH
jgi:hypothetical protein